MKKPLSEVRLGVTCPMANEKDNACAFVKDVIDTCSTFGFKEIRFFAILDNVSTDGTLDLLREMALQEKRLKVVFAPENRCVVDAYFRGYKEALQANSDWILEIDAGYSHQPNDIPRFFETMQEGYDCVFGSRFCPGSRYTEKSIKRRLISRGGTLLTNLMLGTKLYDMASGFELFRRETLERILKRGIHSRGPFFQSEIRAHAHEFNIKELPICYGSGSHRINRTALQDAFKNLWRLFRMRRGLSKGQTK